MVAWKFRLCRGRDGLFIWWCWGICLFDLLNLQWFFNHQMYSYGNNIKNSLLLMLYQEEATNIQKGDFSGILEDIDFDSTFILINQCHYSLLCLSRSMEKIFTLTLHGSQKNNTMVGRVSQKKTKILPSITVFPPSHSSASYLFCYQVLQKNSSNQITGHQLWKIISWSRRSLCR